MGFVSIAQLEQYHALARAEDMTRIIRAVFPRQEWVTFTAIADAESAFDPTIMNRFGAVGLFQILLAAHPGLSASDMLNAWNNAREAYRLYQAVGLSAWAGDGYRQFLAVARALVARTNPTPPAKPAIRIAPTFRATGTAQLIPGGRIQGRLTVVAHHAAIPVTVTMAVTPTYGTQYRTAVTTHVTVQAGQTRTITQQLIAPLPATRLIQNEQQLHPGPVTFRYTVRWVIHERRTGQTQTVTRRHGVILNIA